ncbi:hypothetical protein JHK87_002319 [Glycine soja]|nr:hypothetical protein JHK87_002319 [Glycine soja]
MVASENQAEKKNDSQKSSITDSDKREQEPNKPPSDHVEALHLHNGSASDSSIVEGKDASSRNNHDVGQVENENIDSGKNVYRAHNEPVESQKEKEELTH